MEYDDWVERVSLAGRREAALAVDEHPRAVGLALRVELPRRWVTLPVVVCGDELIRVQLLRCVERN